MRTKLNDLKRNFDLTCYDVVLFSESWLNNDFSNAEVKFAGYEIYRSDRNVNISQKRRGGGYLLQFTLVSSRIFYKLLPRHVLSTMYL